MTNSNDTQRFTKYYMRLIVAAGCAIFAYSAHAVHYRRLDFRFLLLLVLTVVVSSRVAIKIPRANTTITVADSFVFLTLLLYGPEAAVLIAVTDGLSSGLHLSRRWITVLFNAGAMACAIFITGSVARLFFSPAFNISTQPYSTTLILLCVVALTQYLAHTWIVAICLAGKSGGQPWEIWTKHYLWSSLTYFVGVFVAGGIVKLEGSVSFYAVLAPLPVISIIYFTYDKYLEDIRASAAQAEQAERERAEAEYARAEAERLRAEQAERHVEELNRYVEKLEGTGKELQESREHFRHAAFHDALTGLPNRLLFSEHLRIALERARQNEQYLFCVLFLDLDRFKNINDSLGHPCGDELLILVARRLEGCIRQTDLVARFGGDEFGILLDAIESPEDAIRVASKIQQAISAPFQLHNHEAITTASIGVALSSTDYAEAEDMIRDADTAMYRAKDHGKARYEIFDTAMHTRAVTLLRLESDLRLALERQELCVYYQPIISVASGELSGFEALVRWQHPERGIISPDQFIPLAEETGLIVPLGLGVLREACGQLRKWQQGSLADRDLIMSVNLSAKQLIQADLIEKVEEVLSESGINPWQLKLEITETVVMENAELAAVTLARLRGLGVRLSIDDFGTGYSSLSYLNRFPVDTLKVDRSFITRMGEGEENFEIVKTIVTLAGNLGMQVIAEGVETEDQLGQLKLLKCQYAQGYLFSRPLAATDADIFIRGARERQQNNSSSVGLDVTELTNVTFAM
ncbi:MAG TPA: bifunctional diguanylate cyclase/phosphodiesterase [Pyrinomonadaceae bacterium]|nr:bifunctional diguanylate cyclase/phosphodiesterase [Pyrinomonadaceae bacterium]